MLRMFLIGLLAVATAFMLFVGVALLDRVTTPRIVDWLLGLDAPEALTICGLTLDTRNAPESFDPERWRDIPCDALEERDLCVISCFTRGVAPGDPSGCHEGCEPRATSAPAV